MNIGEPVRWYIVPDEEPAFVPEEWGEPEQQPMPSAPTKEPVGVP